MRCLTTGIHSQQCVFRQFHYCTNVTECAYTNLDSTANYTAGLYGTACCSEATNVY